MATFDVDMIFSNQGIGKERQMQIENIIDKLSYYSGDKSVIHAEPLQAKEKELSDGTGINTLSAQEERDTLMEAMDVARDQLKEAGLNVRLKVAENSDRLQVEVFDPETSEVLRRFPPDEIIRLAESMDEMAGLVVNRSL